MTCDETTPRREGGCGKWRQRAGRSVAASGAGREAWLGEPGRRLLVDEPGRLLPTQLDV